MSLWRAARRAFEKWERLLDSNVRPQPLDPVHCALCGKTVSLTTAIRHLVQEHGFDESDLLNAPVVFHDEDGADDGDAA